MAGTFQRLNRVGGISKKYVEDLIKGITLPLFALNTTGNQTVIAGKRNTITPAEPILLTMGTFTASQPALLVITNGKDKITYSGITRWMSGSPPVLHQSGTDIIQLIKLTEGVVASHLITVELDAEESSSSIVEESSSSVIEESSSSVDVEELRITEDSDVRITEDSDSRILEYSITEESSSSVVEESSSSVVEESSSSSMTSGFNVSYVVSDAGTAACNGVFYAMMSPDIKDEWNNPVYMNTNGNSYMFAYAKNGDVYGFKISSTYQQGATDYYMYTGFAPQYVSDPVIDQGTAPFPTIT